MRLGALVGRLLGWPLGRRSDPVLPGLRVSKLTRSHDLDHAPADETAEQSRHVAAMYANGSPDCGRAWECPSGLRIRMHEQDAEHEAVSRWHPAQLLVDRVRKRPAVAGVTSAATAARLGLRVVGPDRYADGSVSRSPGVLVDHGVASGGSGNGPSRVARSNRNGTASPSRCLTQRYSTVTHSGVGPSASGSIPTSDSVAV